MPTFLIQALQLILSLALLIVAHELGHFFFARLFKTRVEKFYLFFNPGFSIFRMKKINGKWHFKFFSKNDTNTRERYNFNNELISEVIPTEELSDNNWKKYPDSTEWGIGWLPIGGYCKIAGMIDESVDTNQIRQKPKAWEFRTKKAWQRLLITIGGVTVNFIAAFLIYSMVLFTWGYSYIEMKDTPMEFSETAIKAGYRYGDRIIEADGMALGHLDEEMLLSVLEAKEVVVLRDNEQVTLQMPQGGLIKKILQDKVGFAGPIIPSVVGEVLPGAPATKFLQAGDRIITMGDSTINKFYDISAYLSTNTANDVQVTIVRNNDTLTQQIPLIATGQDKGKIGFRPASIAKTEYFTFIRSIPAGFEHGISKLTFYIRQMKFLFSKEGISNISGIGGIGSMFAPEWNWHSFWANTAFLSIVLAFLNILPIPALDGGHLIFILYEMITRRKPNEKFMMYAQLVGMLILLSLFLYATGMDISRIFGN